MSPDGGSMHVLGTGGAGFIGSHLVEGLLAPGHPLLVLDDILHEIAGRPAQAA